MSTCITLGGQCACEKIRVKYCDSCEMWVCRVMYPGHRHMKPNERQLHNARRSLIGWIYYRIYVVRRQNG